MNKLFSTLILVLFTQLVFAQTYKVGDAVSIEWKGKWYPGKILEVKTDTYKISYDGYGEDWYETVASTRLKPAGSTTTNTTTQTTNTNSSSFATISEAKYKAIETINDLSLGSDGKTLVAANSYGKITILNATDLTLVADIKLGSSPVGTASINKDCNLIAAADGDGKVYVYEKNAANEWKEKTILTNYSTVSRLEFSPVSNELYIAAAPKENYLNVVFDAWDMNTTKLKFTFLKSTNANHSIGDVALTADGSKIAISISNAKKGIEVYETATGKLAYRIEHKYDVVGLSFSPDGKTIAAGGTDKKVSLWDVATKKSKWTSTWNDGTDAYVYGVSFAPDGTSIAVCGSGGDNKIKIYNPADGKLKYELGASNPGANAICHSANSKIVYTCLRTYSDISKVTVVYMAAIPQ